MASIPALNGSVLGEVSISKVFCKHILASSLSSRAADLLPGEIEVAGQTDAFGEAQLVVFKPGAEIVLRARGSAHLMLLGGEPFPEPRHIYWNFVSSSKERIEQAKDDWRHGRFPEIAGETEFIPLPPDPVRVARADR
ncbi:pirin domain-containing protein (plasmid) [Rhizobium sp. NXC24]|nr:pirin domain-containing protein [Rhizobium sp. NXC24]